MQVLREENEISSGPCCTLSQRPSDHPHPKMSLSQSWLYPQVQWLTMEPAIESMAKLRKATSSVDYHLSGHVAPQIGTAFRTGSAKNSARKIRCTRKVLVQPLAIATANRSAPVQALE